MESAKNLKKRQEVNFISLFSGCGGSSLGYSLLGLKSLLAIDINPICIRNYKLNFPNSEVLIGNLFEISFNEILDRINLTRGELDFLDASPPCQGFSMAGKREVFDKRNELIFDTVEKIREIYPKVFLIENVEGLIKGGMVGLFNDVFSSLQKLGYNVRWKSLNSIYYGVPQSRQRVLIIGYRKDLGITPRFPEPDKEITLIGDVIENLDFHSRGQFDKRLKSKNSLAYTLTKTPSMFFVKNGVKVKPTIDELKILQGFPDWFKFEGSYNDIWGLIGNSVPPPLSYRVGKVIKEDVLSVI